MIYQIAICDDEPTICNLLKSAVRKWSRMKEKKIKVQTFSSAESFYTNQGKYTKKQTLTDLEKELDEGFFRTGRSFLVNLIHIKRTSKTEVELKNGHTIPLSRGKYDAINEAIINYF